MGKEEAEILEILAGLRRERADTCIEKLPEWLKKRRYELLFDAQINTLKNCGLEAGTCSRLAKRKEEVIEAVINMNIPKDNYPFFPNVGKPIGWLARRVMSGNSSAIVNIMPEEVIDDAFIPEFSYTFNINDGYKLRTLSCDEAVKKMGKEQFLTLSELLTMRILAHHLGEEVFRWPWLEMAALGSRLGDVGYPDLYSTEAELCIDCLRCKSSRSFPHCEIRI
jgi:hypothetical protein